MAFLNERFPEDINYGSGFSTNHAARIVTTAGGSEYRSLDHPYIKASLDVDFTRQRDDIINRIIALNLRANGTFRGFRVKNFLDFSTNNYRAAPTAFDQPMQLISAGVYQVMRWYGNPADAQASRRRIRKPVAGTTTVGVAGAIHDPSLYSLDETTGIVTFNANKTGTISAITQESQALVTLGTHTIQVGESVYFSGVVGMTQINGLRATVIARTTTTIRVGINTTLFTAYISGGTVNTQPQSGEAVTAGCYFDIPMRFDADLSGVFVANGVLSVTGVGLVEILNP
jgi:uncharacterized protein (TIGR02217 family)